MMDILDKIKGYISNIKNLKVFQNLDKKKINSILAVAIFVLLLDIFLILKPQFNKITKKYLPQRRKIVQDLKMFKKGVNTLSDKETQLRQLKDSVEAGLSQLTSERDIPKFLSWVSDVAKENKITLMSIKPQGAMQVKSAQGASLQDRYYLLPIDLSLAGGYHQLGTFLNKLEQGNYFVKVSDLVIRADSKGTGKHEISLKLETFILKE